MKNESMEDFLKRIQADPFNIDRKDPEQERLTELFLEGQKQIGLNMAVVMYMVDAMQYFKGMTFDQIKKIAVEIALQGAHGYKPSGNIRYKVSSIPDKTFSGYNILAYYFVSFAIAIPDLLPELNLPYEKEFRIAETFFRKS